MVCLTAHDVFDVLTYQNHFNYFYKISQNKYVLNGLACNIRNDVS